MTLCDFLVKDSINCITKNLTYMINQQTLHPYPFPEKYRKSVAYFSMEFAIDQALKTYSGGLGFLAGSHMKSAYSLKQNLIGIGILWKNGYYDQLRNADNSMRVFFREQMYSFLEDTKIRFTIRINNQEVWVAVYHLPAQVFNTAPMFFLTTDTEGNDAFGRSISYHLYDKNPLVKVAQCMLLGIGGAKFLDLAGLKPQIYHFNEAHAVSAAFYRLSAGDSKASLKERLVFTTHTPEEAGNEKHDFDFLYDLGFFSALSKNRIVDLVGLENNTFNHTWVALQLSKIANGVSKLHGKVSRQMWHQHATICDIIHITNAQNKGYWADEELDKACKAQNEKALGSRKKELKKELFKEVADQAGKLFKPEVLTLVWARRFAAYKRPDLLVRDMKRFEALITNTKYPIQIIWAGKPYPFDFGAIEVFNKLYYLSHLFPNMAVLTGHELRLSKLLKDGADVWLNNPVVTREASGTSGMTAAMNGALNFSTFDGWVCEFATPQNAFVVPIAEAENDYERDATDLYNLLDMLENQILPTYYEHPQKWSQLVMKSMEDVNAYFGSDRMADEYYAKLYDY
jgi:glycogen phosphorylase